MLCRAVQLTFPIQAPGEEAIQDSIAASHYVDLCLNHPSGHRRVDPGIDEIRALNANRGSYLWGDYRGLTITPPPDLKVLNLETAVTKSISNKDFPRKGINYHMHIDNFENILSGFQQETHGADRSIPVVVSLANNHVLDYGRQAFEQETMLLFDRIRKRDFQVIGAGRNLDQASDPAKLQLKSTIVQVFGFSTGCSGTPAYWFADDKTSGLVGIHSLTSCPDVHQAVDIAKTAFEKAPESQIRIVSIHWGPNWALRGETKEEDVTARRYFAHRLIDECNVDLIYGHSSHHARGMEVYKGKLILYGTGDIINDYEGFENPGEEKYNLPGGCESTVWRLSRTSNDPHVHVSPAT
jgi:poly-gamma-glutamate synthesis protein (capsule biosynthesis protein)